MLLLLPSLLSAPRFNSTLAKFNRKSRLYQLPQKGVNAVKNFSGRKPFISWLRSGNNNNASNAQYLAASGNTNNTAVSSVAAVRPALHSTLANSIGKVGTRQKQTVKNQHIFNCLIKAPPLKLFRAETFISWLRSGNNNNANNANTLSASGNNNWTLVSSVAAVRPALHSTCQLNRKSRRQPLQTFIFNSFKEA